MADRRRSPRFLLAAPVDGSFDVREEVAIERWNDGEIQVVSTVPCRVDETLALELAGDGDGQLRVAVRDIRPFVADDGSFRFRLRLSLDPASSTAPDEGQGRS
jgi:hypothetical protein